MYFNAFSCLLIESIQSISIQAYVGEPSGVSVIVGGYAPPLIKTIDFKGPSLHNDILVLGSYFIIVRFVRLRLLKYNKTCV
jgi:hypothetical protein